jgi:AraC-like DNA-binding protein
LVERFIATECQVTYECGFADQSHLNRTFKARYGMTPGTFQALLRTTLKPYDAARLQATSLGGGSGF